MPKELTKNVNFSMTSTEEEKLEQIAKEVLGSNNKSGMVRYWINQYRFEKPEERRQK